MSKAVKKVGKSVKSVAKKAWSNKFVRAAIVATGAIFTAGALTPALGGTALGSGFSGMFGTGLSTIGKGISAAATAGSGLLGKNAGVVGSLMASSALKLAGGMMQGRADQKMAEQRRGWELEDQARRDANTNVSGVTIRNPYAQPPVQQPVAPLPKPAGLEEPPAYHQSPASRYGVTLREIMEGAPWKA